MLSQGRVIYAPDIQQLINNNIIIMTTLKNMENREQYESPKIDFLLIEDVFCTDDSMDAGPGSPAPPEWG